MSQQAIVAQTDQVASVSVSNNFRIHTIGLLVDVGHVTIEARVPGGPYEVVVDDCSNAPIQLDGTNSATIRDISLDAIRFTPVGGASYSAVVTSQAAD